MPESTPPTAGAQAAKSPASALRRRRFALALALGVALAALSGFGGVVAAIAGWLAQPALALALRWRRDRSDARRKAVQIDALGLAALWGVALLATAVLIAWPLAALRETGGLGAALGLSVVAGLVVIGLWRTWPLWHALEREGGGLRGHWQALGERDPSGWHGAAAALAVAAALALVLLLAWPGLLASGTRWILAGIAAVAWPLLHAGIQAMAAPAELPRLAIVEMDGEDAAPLPEIEGDLDTLLFDATRRGRVDRALELLDAGADPHAVPPADARDQRLLPVLAAVLPDLRLLRALIARGVDLNASHAGLTPLLAATRDSWHGRPDAVMTLLANGADPRAVDGEGNTPLHHAARSSDPGVAALLRDAAAEVSALNQDGLTPLGVACAAGNWRLARFLLERGAHPEPDTATPALLAAAGGDEDDAAGVALLLKHKAKANARDRHGRSALHAAALAGHAEIVAVLIDAGADVNARDDAQHTPLLDAARGGRLAAFEALVAARADVAARDGDGRDALMLACRSETPSAALVRRLLELGADSERLDGDGKRAIDHAAAAGRWSLVAALDPDYALPASVAGGEGDADAPPTDRAPLELLREALAGDRFDGHERLLGLLLPRDLGSLLHDAQLRASLPRLQWLLDHGADPDVADGDGDTIVFALLPLGAQALPELQALLAHAASPAGRGGLARFIAACADDDQAGRGLEHFALELLDRGADPFVASGAGDPPLALAVRLGWMQAIERLLDCGVDLDARDSRGMTALHLCAALAREAALKLLVRRGASPEQRAADGQTPLGVALSGGRRDLADWLDWRGWPLPRRALVASDVPAAATVGDAAAVRRLLDLGLPVDASDSQGCTALLRAAGGGHLDTVQALLARGADPQLAAHTGATPLSAAVSMRQGEIVERLLEAGAQLEQRLPGEVTVLMLAAALGLPDLCARLLTAGANIQAADAQGLSPLHCAALFGFTARDRSRLLALFDTLLLAGAEPDAMAAGGVTPLLLLLGARAEPGTACDEDVVLAALDQLLDEEVSLDAQDPRGFGPLHLAALHGQLRLTQRLLRAGCNPDLRDALNRTPREIAVMRGFVDVAGEFVPLQAGVSMARFLRDRG